MKVDDNNKELIKLFMKLLMQFKVLTEEDIVGLTSLLPNEDSIFEMTDWLKLNENATETEIIRKALSIREEFDKQGEDDEQEP